MYAQMEEQERLSNRMSNSENETRDSLETYEISTVTTEFDVVACDDFVEDMGAWVRNMPEEIRRANPDFVPS